MTLYTGKDFEDLARRIKGKSKVVDRISALTINKSATFARSESVKQIIKTVQLKPAYVKNHLKVVKRASVSDLTAVVRGNNRSTLLQRYPYSISGENATVKVNVNGGSQTVVGVRMVKLKGSGEKVLGMFNKDFAEVLRRGLSKGKGATKGKVKKYRQVKKATLKKPYGRWPLHSRSVNQLFTNVREDIQPRLRKFMRETFVKDFYKTGK